MGFRTGMRVFVKQLGEAIIVRLTGDGALVRLVSPDLTIKQPYENIQPIDAETKTFEPFPQDAETETPELLPTPIKVVDMDEFQQLKALEALRFGLVPESHLNLLTLGYDDMAGWIENCLPEQTTCIHEICGPFGTGKSHTLTLIRQIALKQNYLVAQIEIDGQSNNLAAPQRLLYNIWLSLEGKDLSPETPLLDVYLKVIQKGYDSIPKDLRSLDPFPINFEYIREVKARQQVDYGADIIEEALSGSENITATQLKADLARLTGTKRNQIRLKPMTARGLNDKRVMFIQSLAGHALLAKEAGYNGLVVTIDEFEAHHNLNLPDRRKVHELITILEQYVQGDTSIPRAPLAIFFGAVSQDGADKDPWLEDLVKNSGGKRYVLFPWSDADKRELANNIYDLYKSAYEISAASDEGLIDKTESLLENRDQTGLIRSFIKFFMAVLDNQYGPGRSGINGD